MKDLVLRRQLIGLLEGGQAHVTPKAALRRVDPALVRERPPGCAHSMWELLEHLRITQEDILRYTLDPQWASPEFPAGYWPANNRVTEKMWSKSVARFLSDLDEVIGLVRDRRIDLTAEIPHGEGRTYLRQVLLVADHNAYHIGQLVQVRSALGDWP